MIRGFPQIPMFKCLTSTNHIKPFGDTFMIHDSWSRTLESKNLLCCYCCQNCSIAHCWSFLARQMLLARKYIILLYESESECEYDMIWFGHVMSQESVLLSVFAVQDVPPGSDQVLLVTASRAGQSGSCMKCLYIHRGSFKSTPLPTLALKLKDHEPLREKFFG